MIAPCPALFHSTDKNISPLFILHFCFVLSRMSALGWKQRLITSNDRHGKKNK